MVTVTSANPHAVHDGLKEAVVDSLLNNLSARLAGRNGFYRYIYRTKPSAALMSEFLVPMPPAERLGDEEADPIRISAHGLDFQVIDAAAARFRVSLHGAVYVRVYPRPDEICPGGALAVEFPLLRTLATGLRRSINAALRDLAKTLPGGRKDKDWARLSREVYGKECERLGVPLDALIDRNPKGEDGELREPDPDVDATAIGDGEADASDADAGGPRAAVAVRAFSGLRDDQVEPTATPMKWLRLDVDLPSFEFSLESAAVDAAEASTALNAALLAQLQGWAQNTDEPDGGQLWGYRRGRPILPSDVRDWQAYLNAVRASSLDVVLPNLDMRWVITTAADTRAKGVTTVHVALENHSPLLTKTNYKEVEPSLFQVRISLELPKRVHHFLRLDRVKPSYRYNRYLRYPALGFNGGVDFVAADDIHRLSSTWSPRYVLPRVVPTESKVERRIEALAKPEGLDKVTPLIGEYEEWLSATRAHPVDAGLEGPEAAAERAQEVKKHQQDLQCWESELAAIRAGLEILEYSRSHWSGPGPQVDPAGAPFEAWLSMNAAMARVAKQKQYDSWRLFQLAFILASVPAFATRMPQFHRFFTPAVEKHANAVTLLYFSTGGGKSEAFLGLLLFVLFLDRLRGKTCGVSALMRYPLRLLTLQQARRTFSTMGAAEDVRHARKHPGEPFSLGFWVGGSNTPNWHSDEAYADVPFDVDEPVGNEAHLLKTSSKYKKAREDWLKLTACPLCQSKQLVLRRHRNTKFNTLGHYCASTKANCSWNARFAEPTPLPFYIVDEDIYDLAPSVLLGTVDKLAALGQSQGTIRKFFGMFGFAPLLERETQRLYVPNRSRDWDGHPGPLTTKLYPSFDDGEKRFFDPFPALLIQDEAHLLDESLGTFAGLFESALEAGFDRLSELMPGAVACAPGSNERRKVKVIAASATVSEPQRQMANLYQRPLTVQFPHPGPDLYESFYAAPKKPYGAAGEDAEREALPVGETELRSHWARVYASILTNGHRHTVAMASVLGHYHLVVTGLYERLRSEDPGKEQSAKAELLEWLSPGPLQAQFSRLIMAADIRTLVTLVDLHRISLTYVTNKKGGDQVIDTEASEFDKLHEANGYSGQKLASKLISGAVSAADIQEIVRQAETRVKPGEPFPELNSTLRSIIATSAISHGVDVEEFNAMFFAGVPSDIAEYIQASSRVGRTHVGFSLLVPVPQRYRDRFVLEVHDIFHRFLERMILPAAVDRWAEKALVRVLPSFFQEYVCGIRAIELLCAAHEASKPRSPIFLMAQDVRDYLNRPGEMAKVTSFLERALGLHVTPAPDGKSYYEVLIKDQLHRYLNDLVGRPEIVHETRLNRFFELRGPQLRPMTSLRDVDEPGVIRASHVDAGNRRLRDEEPVARAMRFIRHGSGTDSDDSSGDAAA